MAAARHRPRVPRILHVLEEIYEVLERNFVRPDAIDRETLRQAAINGMLEVLGDENTVYIDEEAISLGAGELLRAGMKASAPR